MLSTSKKIHDARETEPRTPEMASRAVRSSISVLSAIVCYLGKANSDSSHVIGQRM